MGALTVIVTCYSTEQYFEEAVQSILDQNYPDVRIVFHDNGCRPSYSSLIRTVAKRVGAKVFRSDVNRYGEGLRYDVLSFIDTPWLAILHDDDFFYQNKLLKSMSAIKERGLDYLFTDRQYVDALGTPLSAEYAEANTSPYTEGSFPHVFIADTFSRGLRLHFSTLIIKTSLAIKNLLGDPYLPRITDALFMTRLLMDPSARGAAIPEKMSGVRIHGNNDMLYEKFAPHKRTREVALLSVAEYFLFQDIVRRAETPLLARILHEFPGIRADDGNELPLNDRVWLLVRAGVGLRPWKRSKKMMATFCIHEAFFLDPFRAMDLVRRFTGSDANAEMIQLYQDYITDEITLLGASADASPDVERRLQAIMNSKSWRLTEPLRRINRALSRRTAIETQDLTAPYLQQFPKYVAGTRVLLNDEAATAFVKLGFSSPEPWGRWTRSRTAHIRLRHETGAEGWTLKVWPVMTFTPDVSVSVNGGPPQSFPIVSGEALVIPIPKNRLSKHNDLDVELIMAHVKAQDEEPVDDTRALGICIESFALYRDV